MASNSTANRSQAVLGDPDELDPRGERDDFAGGCFACLVATACAAALIAALLFASGALRSC